MTTAFCLATRGSTLACAQAASVQGVLAGRRLDAELVEVETTGNRIQDELIHRLGKIGVFVRTPNERVLNGEVDVAVHSMKDMSTEEPTDLVVAGVPGRASTDNMFVTVEGHDTDDLPKGAAIGTPSFCQQAQLLSYRDGLEVEPFRDNVDTRIEKLLATHLQREHEARVESNRERQGKKDKTDHDEAFDKTADKWFERLTELERQAFGRQVRTEYDVITLAEAGLKRSGFTEKVNHERLPRAMFVPAPRQEVIAVIAADPVVIELIRDKPDHPRTHVETAVEWIILTELGGGCIALVGVRALLQGEYIHVDVQVLATGGLEPIKTSRGLSVGNHASAAREFAAALCDRGVGQLVDAAREKVEE